MDLRLRPLTRADFPLVARWLGEPHVGRWWDPRHDTEFVESKYGPRVDGKEPTEVFVVELDEGPIGLFQWCPADQYAWWPTELGLAEDAVVIDGLIGEPERVGRGVGSALLRHVVPRLSERFPDATRILGAPAAANAASCRVLEKAGFTLLHEGELVRDGRPLSRIYALDLSATGGL
ncbi:MAG TPA: GNAT family N-acetyltransferase [Acidimicrobiales bacterium]|nr:GNAT family N-acetyltransferase [Acidimicrobiales bacterium]